MTPVNWDGDEHSLEAVHKTYRRLLVDPAAKAAATLATYKDVLAMAFIVETGYSPSQIELVQVIEESSSELRWFYRKKRPFVSPTPPSETT